MVWKRRILLLASSLLLACTSIAQHPNRHNIDSLKGLLSSRTGISRIHCLNQLGEEYWWPPHVIPDSIDVWARPAKKESERLGYPAGVANATMSLGVAEIYRKKFSSAEQKLKQARHIFDSLQDQRGIAWSNVWLGQTVYSENRFREGINCCKRAFPILEREGDLEGIGKDCAWISFGYAAMGRYDSSFDYCELSLQVREQMSDYICVAGALTNLGHLYRVAEDFSDALDYYRKGLNYANAHGIDARAVNWNYMEEPMGVIYRLMNMPDSSVYYLNDAIKIEPTNKMTYVSMGESLLQGKKYDSALAIFTKPMNEFRQGNDLLDLMKVLLDAGTACWLMGNTQQALKYASEGLAIATTADFKQYILKGENLLYEVYKALRKNDSAFVYLERYTRLKDTVVNGQFQWRLANYKRRLDYQRKTDTITTLSLDNQLKGKALERASLEKWLLVGGLALVVLLGFIIYSAISLTRKNERLRTKELEQAIQMKQLEADRVQAELQQKTTKLEMEVLLAQMNPHFIFNSLNSINRFVLLNDRVQASEYLTKFSKLVRLILQNSRAGMISLESELDGLKLYLELEALRFDHHFDYKVSVPEDLDASIVKIPPLIIQPYVENAIWHGLMHKEEKGHLDIEVSYEDRFLFIRVSDNGIGRTRAAALATKSATRHKSMGLQITAQRIAAMQFAGENESPINIKDLVNPDGSAAGTEVVLNIPLIYD